MDNNPNSQNAQARPPSGNGTVKRPNTNQSRKRSSRINRMMREEGDGNEYEGDLNDDGPEMFNRENDQYLVTKFRGEDQTKPPKAPSTSGNDLPCQQKQNQFAHQRRQSENILQQSPNTRQTVTPAKDLSQQHQSQGQFNGFSASGLVSNDTNKREMTMAQHTGTESVNPGGNPSTCKQQSMGGQVYHHPNASNDYTTNTITANHLQSPIRQKADSSGESNPLVVGQGSNDADSADIVLGENANLEHYLGGAVKGADDEQQQPKMFVSIPEQDIEESSPNVGTRMNAFDSATEQASFVNPVNQSSGPMINVDMDNFVLLSDRQRTEKIGEQVNLDQSVTPLKEPIINEDLERVNQTQQEALKKSDAPIAVVDNNPTKNKSNASIGEINEQVIFSRLPQNYFVQDPEEPGNFDSAMEDIKLMRMGFMAQLSESGMEEHLQEINDILQPQRFIDQCFGNADKPPDFIFNEIIQEVPSPPRKKKDPVAPEMREYVESMKKIDKKVDKIPPEDDSPIGEDIHQKYVQGRKNSPQRRPPANLWDDDIAGDPYVQEDEPLQKFQGAAIETHQRQITKPPIPQIYHQTNPLNELMTIKSEDERDKAKLTNEQGGLASKKSRAKSKTGQKLISETRQPVKNLHMADYFSMPQQNRSNPKERLNSSVNSDLTKDELSLVSHHQQQQAQTLDSLKDHGALSPESILAASASATKLNKDDDQCLQEDSLATAEDTAAMAELDKKLEQDILDNVNINFVFNKGRSLAQGLLDPDRIYNVMSKLKEIAIRQLEQGSKEINYQEIVDYVKSKESIFGEEIARAPYLQSECARSRDEDDIANSLAREPPNIVRRDAAEEDRRWVQCVGFLRNNPKLLLQMIPSELDEKEEPMLKLGKRSKAFEKIKEAQKWNSRQHTGLRQFRVAEKTHATTGAITEKGSTNRTHDKLKRSEQERSQAYTKLKMAPTSCSSKLQSSQVSSQRKGTQKVNQWASFGKIEPSEQEMQDQQSTGAQIKKPKHLQQISENVRSSTERRVSPTVNIVTEDGTQSKQTPFGPHEPLSRISKVSETSREERVFSAFTHAGDNNSRQTSTHLTNIAQGAQRLQVSYDFTRTNANWKGLPQEAIIREMQKQKRPTTASDFNQQKKFKKSLASNSILQTNMMSRSSGRQNYFTHVNKPGVNCKEVTSSLSGTRSSPRVAPRLPTDFTSVNKGAYLPAPNPTTVVQELPKPLIKPNSQGQSRPRATYNSRHFGRMHAVKSGEASTLPHQLPQHMGKSKSMAKSPKQIRQVASHQPIQPKTMINERAGVLQFYPHDKPREATSPKRLLKVKNRRQKNKRKDQAIDQQNTISQNSQQMDRSILGDEASSVQDSTVILAVKDGSPIAQKRETQEPVPYLMKSSRAESGDGPDEDLLEQTSQPPLDPLKLPLITQQANLPIRFDDQSTHQQIRVDDSFQKSKNQQQFQQSDSRNVPSFEAARDHTGQPTTPAEEMTFEQAQGFIDWAFTPLCVRFLKKETEFNPERDIKLFVESELDYVIDMMRSKFKDFERTEIMRPFYLKALSTLRNLLLEQHMDARFQQLYKQYREITIENTLKLLLRCKLAFHTRGILLKIFQLQLAYELNAHDMKRMLDSKTSYKVRMESFNEIREAAAKMAEAGQRAIQAINTLRQDKKSQYRQRFVFKRKDLVKYIRNEISEVKKLVMIFRPKRVDDSSDSDEPMRMVCDPDVVGALNDHDRREGIGEHGQGTISKVTVTEHIDIVKAGYQSGVSVIEEADNNSSQN